MRRVRRSALLPHPGAAVFALVDDIDRYEEFLPWCHGSTVLSRSGDEVTGRIAIRIGGREEVLVTRNRAEGEGGIELTLIEGPFDAFEGRWTFTPLGDGCKVELEVAFQLHGRLLSLAAGPFIDRIADRVVDAFARRADELLGGASGQ